MNNYDYVSELGKDVGALRELGILVNWFTNNPNPKNADLTKYVDERLITLTNKPLKERNEQK